MGNGTIFGRQPILVYAFIVAVLNVAALWLEFTSLQVVALNGLAIAAVGLLANVALTPIGDARLANGTQVNSGQSVVVPQAALSPTVTAASILTPPATDNAPDGGPA